MTSSDANDRLWESERSPEPGRIPGDELYMMTGDVYILCSVTQPSTRWIASNATTELRDWE